MDYKDTLHLPNTQFEMRGNLVSKQGRFVNKWQDNNLYERMREVHSDREEFVYHDGPPYANGDLHVGHGLNRILKDFIVRSRHKLGYQVHFIPGWDTHGLPIETELAKKGVDRKSMDLATFREKCQEYAQTQVALQMQEMIDLGTIADFKHPYITYQKDFEATQVELFAKMVERGMIYKGLKPVYWSPSSETALAEAEIEYHDRKDPAIFVRFKVKDGQGVLELPNTYFVIWTTTPWTIPGNLAISLHPRYTYALVQVGQDHYIMLDEFVEDLMKQFGFEEYQVIQRYQGKELEYITTQHPLYDRDSIVILGEHVTNDSGTGCVHTAPGFGMDDYLVGLKYGLEPYCNVNGQGRMMDIAGDWLAGQTTDEANKTVTNRLHEQGDLLKLDFITHSYPHDWRTKKPIIFRATDQWFASINVIREQLLREIDNVKWKPSWGKLRMHNMIADRNDWTISRQRAWGLPIPIFYAQDKTPIMDQDLFQHVADLFREHGSNIWFEKEVMDLLPEGYTHPNSPDGIFYKETDTLDVWFDSGSSHTAALAKYGKKVPHDLYMEGSDQYRGWFNSSLIISTACFDTAPYKQIVSHGFVVDEKGEKLSKSKGKALQPKAITDRLGAEIMRLWVASVDYTSDVTMSEAFLKQVSEQYRKIRNTFRFLHGNVSDFDPKNKQDLNSLPSVDKQVLFELNKVLENGIQAYKDYEFASVMSVTSKFLTNVMSAYYLDFTKDILYIHSVNDTRRLQVQTVLTEVLESLMHLLTPILPFTMEELFEIVHPDEESVQLADFITHVDVEFNDEADFEKLFDLREAVYKALEEARAAKLIGNSLKAKVLLNLDPEMMDLVEKHFGADLKQWFIVSQVEFTQEILPTVLDYQVQVQEAQGVECERCWNVVEEVHDGLCDRCTTQLES